MIWTVTFNPAVDYVMHVPTLDLGQVNRSRREEVYFGGKGINVSLMLQNLGIPSKALGFTAGFTGAAIESAIRARGVETDFVPLSEGLSRINIKIKSAEETDLNGQGPAIPEEAVTRLLQKLEQLCDGDILVLAGSIPDTLPPDIYERILRKLAGRKILPVVDATGRLLRSVLPFRPFLIKPNHHELGELFGVAITSPEEALHYAAELRQLGARNVLVSMAEMGALLLDEEGQAHRIGVPHGVVVNSVGAGDSMVAGFLAGWLRQHDYASALRLGAASGSATAFSEGLGEAPLIHKLWEEL